ncbi:MAG TPA: alpha/beta hydrolase [Solirubrobacteraceae bacterium]|nr:alpha/beta hydrolase [Solirubrobacteraceae bacterium]
MRKALRILLYVLAALALVVVVLNWTVGRLPAEPKPGGFFVTVDGLRIHYFERAGTGTPVVLLHGLPGTAEDWNEVTPLLAGHRTIAIDRPGFGWSTGGYTKFARQLEVLDALLVRLDIKRPILVGHSYGGTIALGFAERYPRQAGGLVLVDAAAAGTHSDSFTQAEAHLVKFLQLPVVHQVANATFGQLMLTAAVNAIDDAAFEPQPVNSVHKHRALAINMTSGNLKAYAGEELEANDVFTKTDSRLGSIELPAIVIQGRKDQLVGPEHGQKLARELPNAQLEMIPGGHMAPYTHPYTVAAAVRAVAAQAATATPSDSRSG